jgi:hypothetical protein
MPRLARRPRSRLEEADAGGEGIFLRMHDGRLVPRQPDPALRASTRL